MDDKKFGKFVMLDSINLEKMKTLMLAESNLICTYGHVSSGKTLLLKEAQNFILENKPLSKILKLDTNEICEELVSSLKKNTMNVLINNWLAYDVIIIDQFEELNTKPKTFNILTTLIKIVLENGKLVIISSLKKELFEQFRKLENAFFVDLDDINSIDISRIEKQIQSNLNYQPSLATQNYSDFREYEGMLKLLKFKEYAQH
jgi:chromosomal replication initiation ATPase DnaA